MSKLVSIGGMGLVMSRPGTLSVFDHPLTQFFWKLGAPFDVNTPRLVFKTVQL